MEQIRFKSHKDLAYDAFYSCRVLDCKLEAEKLYATESSIIDVCLDHYNQLLEKSYR
jgi:hypothetical protein